MLPFVEALTLRTGNHEQNLTVEKCFVFVFCQKKSLPPIFAFFQRKKILVITVSPALHFFNIWHHHFWVMIVGLIYILVGYGYCSIETTCNQLSGIRYYFSYKKAYFRILYYLPFALSENNSLYIFLHVTVCAPIYYQPLHVNC